MNSVGKDFRPETLATLDQLAACDWFSALGKHDTSGAKVLSSWSEASKHCSSKEWQDLCYEAVDQYTARLSEIEPECLRGWNDLVRRLKPLTEALVEDKTGGLNRSVVGSAVFDAIRWDILHVGIECESAHIYPPGFYMSQAYWYTKGHFPCGWDGVFPNGKLIIF